VSIAKLKAETQDRQYGRAVKSARELIHTVLGKAWEDTASVFRQLDSIGPKAIAKLSSVGVHSESGMVMLMENKLTPAFDQLLATDAGQLEFWHKRLHPYGMEVHRGIEALPRYTGTAT
jgi:ATP-dependent DNA helicase HFM1/MER3